jgi:hypothetical protein
MARLDKGHEQRASVVTRDFLLPSSLGESSANKQSQSLNRLDPTPLAGHDAMSLPGDQQLTEFSARFPLPLRVLSLVTLGTFAFASNLHLLRLLGLDAAFILDLRLLHESGHTHIHPSRLYPPIYHVALSYTAFTAAGWLAVQFWPAYGERLSALWLAVGLIAAGWPFRFQRAQLLRSLKRVLFDGLWTPVAFCDVIFGDILTSFAKVLGELWLVFVAAAGVRVGWGEPLMTA